MKLIKKTIIASSLVLLQAVGLSAQDIQLPKPDLTQQSKTVIEALSSRHSVREYSDKELSDSQLSTLCWAAIGINREDGRLTSPTAMNRQEIRLFVFMKNGTYEYIAKDNLLKKVADGDHRNLVAGRQASVAAAPVCLVMVADLDKFGRNDANSIKMTCADAGYVSQNINLYCEAVGLATVPRASMEHEAISELLGLGENQTPLLNNPVGYPKE